MYKNTPVTTGTVKSLPEIKEILLFYAGESEQKIEGIYEGVLGQLQDADIILRQINISQEPQLAERYGIDTIPLLLLSSGRDSPAGVIDELRIDTDDKMLQRSIAYHLGFRTGRQTAREKELAGSRDKDQIEAMITSMLDPQGVQECRIRAIDQAADAARLELQLDRSHTTDNRRSEINQKGVIGGIFTEVMQRGVIAEIAEQNNTLRTFTVKRGTSQETSLKDEHQQDP
jgi:hypothetical protein